MSESKPIIGVDGNEANHVSRVGVNTYAYEVLKSIHKLEDEWKREFEIRVYLKNQPLPHMPKATSSFTYEVLEGTSQWILSVLMPHLFIAHNKPSVFWSPSHYIPPFAPMPRVCSIMDLGYLEFSEQFKKYDFWQLKLWTAWSINNSKKVLAISETTRKDIIKRYSSAEQKTVTTLLGYDHDIYPPANNKSNTKAILAKYAMGPDYVLFMSTLKPSKNIEGLVRAWALIEKEYPKTCLVVAGKKGWLFESIFQEVKNLQIENRVIFTDFIDEEDKPTLIQNARVFVLPSFWEGFGLDVVSSMACGVPTIVSNRGSLPEVVGDEGIVVNPDDQAELAKAISRVLSANVAEYKKLSQMSVKQATHFDWDQTAKKTVAVLRGLL